MNEKVPPGTCTLSVSAGWWSCEDRLGGVKLGTQINRVMVDREEMSDQ